MYDTRHNYGTFCLLAGSYTIEARAFVSVNVFFAIFTNFLCQARQRGAPFAPTYFRHPGYSRSGICGRVRYLYLVQ